MVKRDVFEWDTHNLKIGKREGLRRMREKERERGEKERETDRERSGTIWSNNHEKRYITNAKFRY